MEPKSQSRYGILEELNQKKINAMQEIAKIKKQYEFSKMEFERNKTNLESRKASENASYMGRHKDFIARKEYEKKEAVMNCEAKLASIDIEIEKANFNVESNHEAVINDIEKEIKYHDDEFRKFDKNVELDLKRWEKEVELIESSIADIKSVSNESAKKAE